MPLETEARKRMRRLKETRERKARRVRDSKKGKPSATEAAGSPRSVRKGVRNRDTAGMSPAEAAAAERELKGSGAGTTRRGRSGTSKGALDRAARAPAPAAGPPRSGRKVVRNRETGAGKPVSGGLSEVRSGNTSTTIPSGGAGSGKGGETFGQAFAREREAQGAGGTFTYKGESFTTDRADDKPKASGNGLLGKLGGKFKAATTLTPGRPRKPRGKVGMNSPQMRKYRKEMQAFRKEQESSKAKASGGRVTAKKPTAKKPTAKKPLARTTVKKRTPRRP